MDDIFAASDGEDSSKPKLSGGFIRRVLSRWWLIVLFVLIGAAGGFYKYSISFDESHVAMGVLELTGIEKRTVGTGVIVDRRGLLQKVTTTISKLSGVSALSRVAQMPEVQSLEHVVPPKQGWKPRYMQTKEELLCKPSSEISPQALAGMIGGWLNIRQREGTAMVEVRVVHPDRQTAIVIAQSLMLDHIKHDTLKKEGGARETYTLLQKQASEASIELENLEKSLRIYESAVRLSEEVNQNRVKLADLDSRYRPKHPKLIQARAATSDLLRRFQAEIRYVATSTEEVQYWKSKILELRNIEERIKNSPDSSTKLKQEWITIVQNTVAARTSLLETKVANKQTLYSTLVQRISELDITAANYGDEVVIAEVPVIVGMDKTEMTKPIVMGSVMGCIAGLALAALCSIIDYKVYDVISAEEETGLSCLAAVPEATDLSKKNVDWQSVLKANTSSVHAEAIRNLRASVLLLGRREDNQVLMLTSAAPAEGKTTLAAELAVSLAMNEEKVILVDFDLRKPRIHQLFSEVKGESGVSELFSGQKELEGVIHKVDAGQLSVIGAGAIPPNPADLLSQNNLTSLLQTLRSKYDRIILDTPPVLPVADARILACYVDKVIMVVRASYSPIGAIIRAKNLLASANVSFAGIVINALNQKRVTGSYKGYKHYGEYGSKGGYSYYSSEKK